MDTEENYLDKLLKTVTEPRVKAVDETVSENLAAEESEVAVEEPIMKQIMPEETGNMPLAVEIPEDLNILEELETSETKKVPNELELSDVSEEFEIPETIEVRNELDSSDISEEFEMLETPEVSNGLETSDVLTDAEISEMSEVSEGLELSDISADAGIPEASEGLELSDISVGTEMPETVETMEELEIPEVIEGADGLEINDVYVKEEDLAGAELILDDIKSTEALEAVSDMTVLSEMLKDPE
ncbi:MAG: hypothetical protein K2N90_13700, partial [Lachnospiraceae bacterium]|nr:hypothetical protein [Lachnospiraceae bacterium]